MIDPGLTLFSHLFCWIPAGPLVWSLSGLSAAAMEGPDLPDEFWSLYSMSSRIQAMDLLANQCRPHFLRVTLAAGGGRWPLRISGLLRASGKQLRGSNQADVYPASY
jgi:hypothetical protein